LDAVPLPADCLVIFDCDGVLVDGEQLAVAIDVRAIGALGWPITEVEVIERHLGRSNADVLADIAEHIGRPVPADWDEAWNAEYRRVFDEQLEAVPGVAEAIKVLAAEGFGAGMRAIGFAGGMTPVEHLAAADTVITDMADLSGAVSLLLS